MWWPAGRRVACAVWPVPPAPPLSLTLWALGLGGGACPPYRIRCCASGQMHVCLFKKTPIVGLLTPLPVPVQRDATLRLALKICLNVLLVSRVVSLVQPARALIDSSVNFLQPKMRSELRPHPQGVWLYGLDPNVSELFAAQPATLSEVIEAHPASMALNASLFCRSTDLPCNVTPAAKH